MELVAFLRRRLLTVLVALLVLVDTGAFLLYRAANPDENLMVQGWGFLNSDAFRELTIGFALPILLVVAERVFNIRAAIRERIERQRQARRDACWESIKRTAQLWSDVSALCIRARYLGPRDRKGSVELLHDLQNAISPAEEVVNEWTHSFPRVPNEAKDNFVVFLNAPYAAAIAVAEAIERGATPSVVRSLQHSLDVIRRCAKDMAHHGTLSILKHAARLDDPDLSSAERGHATERMDSWCSTLASNAEFVEALLTSVPLLPEARGAAEVSVNRAAADLEAAVRAREGKKAAELQELEPFQTAYFAIPAQRIVARSWSMSAADYATIAQKLLFESLVWSIDERAEVNPKLVKT